MTYSIIGILAGIILIITNRDVLWMTKGQSVSRTQRLYRGFVCFDIVFIATALALHFLNIIHYTSFILPCYFISFSEAFPFLVHGMRRRHHEKRQYFDQVEYLADRILNFGFLSYVITSFTDALIFSYVRYSGGQEATVCIPLVTLGSLLFSVAICIHYFLFGIVNVRADSTRKTLHAKAYSDSLTGLANRGRFDQLLLQLAKDKVPYTIISMDLDHLKDVNDAFSHAEGDRMLQTFAETLSEVFADAAMVGRIGGDEFMVVLTGEARRRAYTLIKALEGALDELNAKEEHINYSVSVGVAVSDELPAGRPVRDIYFLADSRMYEMKRGKHSSSVRKEVTSHVE